MNIPENQRLEEEAKNQNIREMKNLVNKLNYHRNLYYNKNMQEISDYEYDNLFDKLQNLENKIGVVLSNSPTKTVGYEVKSELSKVKHSHPMLSLDKTKDVNTLIKFANKQDCILSYKCDGLTVLLTYENGELIQAETRGDGVEGELITHNAKVFDNIPLTIPIKTHVEIEGEAVINYNDFERINAELPDDKKYKNPRNLVSGSVRQLDSKVAAGRHIKFIVWKVPMNFSTYVESFIFARDLGFDVVPFMCIDNEHNDIEHAVEFLKDKKTSLPFAVDGLVMSYNDIVYGKSLGTTGHHPKHSIAFKFYNEEYETTLKNIEWQIGKTGQITPVAVFEPTEIEGSIIERASLSNLSVMENTLGDSPFIGQTLYVSKRNEVIPKIEHADIPVSKDDLKVLYIPSTCPMCHSNIEIKQDNNSKVLICTNPNCKGKLLSKLKHFVSKSAMNIVGLSDSTLEKMINLNLINSFTDIYKLKEYQYMIKEMDGFGYKSTKSLIDAIEKSKTVTLDKFINSLSIPMVGKEVSKLIAKYCIDHSSESCDAIHYFLNMAVHNHSWSKIDNVGYVILENINEYVSDNYQDIIDLLEYVTIKDEKYSNVNSILSGKIFCITGSLEHFSNRDEAKEKIELCGGKVSGSVSTKTDYLVNNDINSNSSKNKKAKELNIPIITENQLLDMLI